MFIGLGVLVVGITVLVLGVQQSPALWQAFQCGYDLGINNSSLTQEQIRKYCNNRIQEIGNNPEDGLITAGIGTILIVISLIITGVGGVWFTVRATTRKERPEASSSGMSVEMMMNNNRGIEGEQDYRFTLKKALAYCIIVGLTSAILSIFIDGLRLLSMAAFVFASITIWYMFGEKLHRWKERKKEQSMFNGQ